MLDATHISAFVGIVVLVVGVAYLSRTPTKNILVVVHNDESAANLRAVLSRHKVTVSEDGKEANDKNFDFVLLDDSLPMEDRKRIAKALERRERIRKMMMVSLDKKNKDSIKRFLDNL